MDELERLNYVNGRRLQAGDLRAEQHYHVATRRLLNRGLFTSGVAEGLEVTRVPISETEMSPTDLSVGRGFALDPHGRELVLANPVTISVPTRLPTAGPGGYFLVLSYGERAIAAGGADCEPTTAAAARVREEPTLEWTEQLPWHRRCGQPDAQPLDCAVTLALVTLTATCQIDTVETSLREIAQPRRVSQVTAMALEGEQDIDFQNPKQLFFQIRGGRPAGVYLFLRGGRLSSLHYTELARHDHALEDITVETVELAEHVHDMQHTHPLAATTMAAGAHGHALFMENKDANVVESFSTRPWGGNFGYLENGGNAQGPQADVPYVFPQPDHAHDLPPVGPASAANTGGYEVQAPDSALHDHEFSAGITETGAHPPPQLPGITPDAYRTRVGAPHTYPAGMTVKLDGTDDEHDLTARILGDLQGFGGQLGDGSGIHPFVGTGTQEIDLLEVARSAGNPLDLGEHVLTFSVPEGEGGKVHYTLIIE